MTKRDVDLDSMQTNPHEMRNGAPAHAKGPVNHSTLVRQYVAYTSLFNACRALVTSTFVLYLVDVLNIPLAWTTILLAVDLVTSLLAEVPTGLFADVRGRRASFIVACAVSALGYGLYGSVPLLVPRSQTEATFLLAACGEALLAVGFAFYSGALDAWVIDGLKPSASEREIGVVLAQGQLFKNVLYLVSGVAGAFAYIYVIRAAWVNAFLFAAIVAFALLAHAGVLMSRGSDDDRRTSRRNHVTFKGYWGLFRGAVLELLANRRLAALAIAGALCFSLLQVLVHLWPYFLTRELSLSKRVDAPESLIALSASWGLAYGARAFGNEVSRRLIVSSFPPMAGLATAVALGSVVVGLMALLPNMFLQRAPNSMLMLAGLLYAAARFSDGLADPLRIWVYAKLTDSHNRATMLSTISFVSLALSSIVALGTGVAIDAGLSVAVVLLGVATIQLGAVPLYWVVDQPEAASGTQ